MSPWIVLQWALSIGLSIIVLAGVVGLLSVAFRAWRTSRYE